MNDKPPNRPKFAGELVLASSSPYRRQLLERLGLPFEVYVPEVDETALPDEPAASLARRLALEKASAVLAKRPDALVIGADQVAECRGRMLGKPGNEINAIEQLMWMSNHQVCYYSAVALISPDRQLSEIVTTELKMRRLDRSSVENYVRRDQPFNCAGAMRSESLGIALTEYIRSDDPSALIGLPLIATIKMLATHGVDVLSGPSARAFSDATCGKL